MSLCPALAARHASARRVRWHRFHEDTLWRKQGLDGHVPASFGEVLAALDVWADAVLLEAAKAG